MGGDGVVDVVGFDCAWSGDHGHRVTADDNVADPDTASVMTMGCAREQRLDGHRGYLRVVMGHHRGSRG